MRMKKVGTFTEMLFIRKTNRKALSNELLRASVLAERTGLEPATPGVTGRYSNQLNYHSW